MQKILWKQVHCARNYTGMSRRGVQQLSSGSKCPVMPEVLPAAPMKHHRDEVPPTAEAQGGEVAGDVVLVTGGAGFLGQHVISQLQQHAPHVREIRVLDLQPFVQKLGERWPTLTSSVQTVLRSFLNARINKHFRKYIDTYTRSHLYKCNYTWLYIKVHDYKMRHIVKKTTKHKITDFKNKQKYIHWLFCLTNLGLYKYISHEKFEKIVHFNVKLVVAMLQSTRPPSL